MDPTVLHEASVLVWKIGVPFILASGTFGNIMVLLVQRRLKDSSGSNLSVYFTCLAIADLTAIWCDPPFWFLEKFGILVFTDWLCKSRVFLAYFSAYSAPAILVTMTFHRAASILWPLKVNVHCNTTFTRSVMAAIFVFFALLNAHILYGHTASSLYGNQTTECFFSFVSKDYEEFFDNVYGWVDTSFAALAPFGLLLAANCVLIWKVKTSLTDRRQKLAIGQLSSRFQTRESNSSMTVTLISVSFSFFLLRLPLSVYFTYVKRFSEGAKDDEYIAAANELALAVTCFLYFLNNSINFYLYCLTGSKYRLEFARIFYRVKDVN